MASVAGLFSSSDSPELSSNDLSLPFGIERDTKNRSALFAQELDCRHSSLRSLIACTKVLDDNMRLRITFWALPAHNILLLGMMSKCAEPDLPALRTYRVRSQAPEFAPKRLMTRDSD